MSKNMVEPEGPQMTSQYGAYTLNDGYGKLHAHPRAWTPARTHRQICNTYCFPAVTVIREFVAVRVFVHPTVFQTGSNIRS